jgi:hypothetical protein
VFTIPVSVLARILGCFVSAFTIQCWAQSSNSRSSSLGVNQPTLRLSELLDEFNSGRLMSNTGRASTRSVFSELMRVQSYAVNCQAEATAPDFTPSNWIERNLLDFFPEQTDGLMTFYQQPRRTSSQDVPFVLFYRMLRSSPQRDIRWFGNIQSRGQSFECVSESCSQIRGSEVFALAENRSSSSVPIISGRRWILISVGATSGLRAKLIVALRLRGVEHFRVYQCSLSETLDQIIPVLSN